MTPELEKRLKRSKNLPSPPGVATRIIELANDPDTDIKTIADVVQLDPAIASKVLRIANSPMYAQQRKCANLRQALVVLGLNATLSLALSFSLIKKLESDKGMGLDYRRYWRRTLLAATASKAIGEMVGERDGEELFLAALLQDLGMVALDKADPQIYRDLDGERQSRHEAVIAFETEQLGSDHADVGGWLLRKWNLPERICTAVEYSHAPDQLPARSKYARFTRCVALSGLVADIFVCDKGNRPFQAVAKQAESLLSLDATRVGELLENISALLPGAAEVFETQFLAPGVCAENILEEGQEALMLRNLSALKTVEQLKNVTDSLESRTRLLEESNRRDTLTGLFNRGFLDRYLVEAYEYANRTGTPVSVAFADLDRFKAINDTYGHAVGDQVLVETARILRDCVRASDIVARYGGEEFVLVLPGADARIAHQVCQRIVESFRNTRHRIGGGEDLSVTISVGVATHGLGSAFEGVDDLVKAADQAVYGAKMEGRDRVVPFRTIEKRAGGITTAQLH
jgi:diguanylate cyclase (GGDEF)-like protein